MRQTGRRASGARGTGVALAALLLVILGLTMAMPLRAQDLSASARLTGPGTLSSGSNWLVLNLTLSQPVPYRARLWSDPPRAVLDFRTLDFAALGVVPSGRASALRTGDAGGGWSRLVIELDRPLGIDSLGLITDPVTGTARLRLRMTAVDAAEFARQAAALDPSGEAVGARSDRPGRPGAAADGSLRVVLDPGHGGRDPGAVQGGLTEAALVLGFALDLAEALRRAGGFEVVLTRDSDVFVSLESRIRLAREARADLFISLHADALEDGQAAGVTLYTLSDEASDAASAALAERHDRANLLGGGADMTGIEDEVALVLMDIARTETRPRTERLVGALTDAIRGDGLRMHPRPWQEADFSVLKAADIPSVLIELGFLSNPRDRDRLVDPDWRARMVAAMVSGLERWRDHETGRALLLRQ
jgi:N-acetylmuramoyl-L-alanine amidase